MKKTKKLTGAEISEREFMKNFTAEQIEIIHKELKKRKAKSKVEKDFRELTRKEKQIFVWIKYISLEFKNCSHYNGYSKFINNYIVPMEIMCRKNAYKDIYLMCPDALFILKELLGHHYHMWLFIELKEQLKEIIE